MDTKRLNSGKEWKSIAASFYRAGKSFGASFPILLGVILFMGLFRAFVSKEMISSIFTGVALWDTITGAAVGSISAGNPITSYIIGGELLKEGVTLFAVTAFIVAWVTVGVVQLPAETAILGKRFAISRNILSFLLAILVSLATVTTLTVLP